MVADVLEGMDYQVTRVFPEESADDPVSRILKALFAQEYRIVHIAGHGVYDAGPRPAPGC